MSRGNQFPLDTRHKCRDTPSRVETTVSTETLGAAAADTCPRDMVSGRGEAPSRWIMEVDMATVNTNVSESVYQIKRWRGVNEAQEGEASLEMGEAAVMRNFKVTAGGALQKRGGSVNVAGLLNSYTVEVDEDNPQVLFTENGSSTLSLTLYPGVQATSMGVVEVTGSPVTVTEESADSYEGYYYKDESGAVYRFEGVTRSRV